MSDHGPPPTDPAGAARPRREPLIVPPGAGRSWRVLGCLVTAKVDGAASDGRLLVTEIAAPANTGLPLCRMDPDLMMYGLAGTTTVTGLADGRLVTTLSRPGAVTWFPPRTPSARWNHGPEPLRLLEFSLPAGQERFYEEFGTPVAGDEVSVLLSADSSLARMLQALPRHGVQLVDPDRPSPEALAAAPPVHCPAATGECYWLASALVRVRLDAGQTALRAVLCEVTQYAGLPTALHQHPCEQVLYLTGGSAVLVTARGGRLSAAPLAVGYTVYVPPRVPHAVAVTGQAPCEYVVFAPDPALGAIVREVGVQVKAPELLREHQPGPPSEAALAGLAAAARRLGHQLIRVLRPDEL